MRRDRLLRASRLFAGRPQFFYIPKITSLKLTQTGSWNRVLVGVCLLVIIAGAVPAGAQETDSVGDAARVFRAKKAALANQDSTHPPLPAPLSASTLVAWQIAGMSVPDVLDELQSRGIAFAPDDVQLNAFKEARIAPEVLAALPKVPSHPAAPNSVEVPRALIAAAQAFGAKEYREARHALEDLAQQIHDANFYAALGNVDLLSHDLSSAKNAFLQSEQIDPNFVYAHVRLADIYYRLEETSEVAEEARKVLRLQPGSAAAHKYLALSATMESQGSVNSKNDRIEDITDLKGGDNPEGKDLNRRGVELAHQGSGSWTQAEAAYRSALQLDPQVPAYYFNLGNLYLKMGRTEEALTAFRHSKALAPRNMAVRQNVGYTLCHAGRYADAVSEFRELLAIDANWNMARPCLAEALRNLERVQEAEQVMRDYTRLKAEDDSGDDGEADKGIVTAKGPQL